MSEQTNKLAILFADICGSTALYEQLGDKVARQLISRCLTILKGALITHSGTLVKTIGDEILCTFPTAENALNAACEMQLAIKTDNQTSEHPLYIRIGFHFGEVICEDDDIFGDAVNIAARIAAITRANQIMTTPVVAAALPLSLQHKVRHILRTDLKGKQEKMDIFQVMWELEDMGSTRIGVPAFRKPKIVGNELVLTFRGLTYTVNDLNKKLILGRDDNCQVVIKNDFASRQHANIEFKSGNFILADHSSNGTYIRSGDNIIRLSREDTALSGNGTISLGQPDTDNTGHLVEYSIRAINSI